MENITEEDLSDKVNIKSGDEIEVLANSFNSMTERLKNLIDQVYVTKLKHKDAEIQVLQAQINPHFSV